MKLCAFMLLLIGFGANGAPLDEDFGYVDVRPGAHMFWVVYHTEVSAVWTDAPLIMWLQGGPGASGVGYGNFKELGPYDIYGNLRPGRWTLKANVMFVDNPVGTGYSYVDDFSLLTTTNQEIADDLLILIQSVFASLPEMQVMPFFVYAESYGGKMTVDFARVLVQAIATAEINCNFQGVALGDSWISPMDSVNTWGTYLYWMGFVNAEGQARIDAQANLTQAAVDAGDWVQATNEWAQTETVVLMETNGVDFYNVLAENGAIYSDPKELERYSSVKPGLRQAFLRSIFPLPREQRDDLTVFMDGPQAQHWNIPANVLWGSQSYYVFNTLEEDFMKPVIDSVSDLLTNSNIHVSVYTGDLDLICDTPGTYRWIENMQYPQKPSFEATNRQSLKVTAYPNNAAYVQRFERFSLFTILRSGHMVPIDAPGMCLNMIDMITQYGAEAGGAVSKKLNHGKTLKNNVQKLHSKISAAKTSNEEEINAEKETHIKEIETKIEHAINHHKAEHVPKHASKKEHTEHVIKEHKTEHGPIPVIKKEHTEHIKEHNAEHVPKQVIKKEETKSAKEEVKPKIYEQIELSPRVSDLLKEKLHQNRNVHAEITKPATHEKQPEPAGHHPTNAHIRDIKAHAAMPAARNVFHNSKHKQN